MDTLMRVLNFLERLMLRRKQLRNILSAREEKAASGLTIILEMASCKDVNNYWLNRK
jgi:hypothetical protein